MPSPSGSYGRLADEIWLDFKILKILYRLDFYLVYSSAMLLIVLEVYIQSAFLKQSAFKVCFVVCKLWSPFFSCQSLLLGTSVPNDNSGCISKKDLENTYKCKHEITMDCSL